MDIDFDPAKDVLNRLKHGVSLGAARRMDWESVVADPDTRRAYGEPRMVGYGLIDQHLHCVVYVMRSSVCRVISLRKANRREIAKIARRS